MKALGFAVVTALAVALSGGWSSTAEAQGTATLARRTLSCTTQEGALQVTAAATNPTIGSANVTISTGNPTQATGLLGVSSQQPHYGLGGRCHSVVKHVALSRRGLASAGVVHAGDVRSPTLYCAATRRVLIRLLISYGASEKPVSATIEVVTQPKGNRKSKRIAYVQWSPQRSVTYYSSACTSQI
jgi:predicted PP-loop superfamily ATPase